MNGSEKSRVVEVMYAIIYAKKIHSNTKYFLWIYIHVDVNARKMFGQTHPRLTIVFYLGQGLGLESVLKGTLTCINELLV